MTEPSPILLRKKEPSSEQAPARCPSAADAAAVAYALSLTASFLLSHDRAESLWGTMGWHMGFLTELLFLSYYFLARIFPVDWRAVGAVAWCCAAAVLALALADRLGWRFLPFLGQDESFISTIGNLDWFCGALALALALALGLWLGGSGDGQRASAWIRVPGFLLLLLGAACTALLGTDSGLLLLISLVLGSALAPPADRHSRGLWRGLRLLRPLALAVLLLFLLGLLLLPLAYLSPRELPSLFGGEAPFQLGQDDFGNGRGAIWRISWDLYRELPWYRKLFGVGPDAYAAYAYDSPRISAALLSRFGLSRLTNAHSELLTLLVDEGACAAAAWAAFLIASLASLLRRDRDTLGLTALLALLALTTVQAVTFRTVTATPLLFVLLGVTVPPSARSTCC